MTTPSSVPAQGEAMENDCEEQGFTTYDYGCNVCPNKGWAEDGKPIRYAIVQRGHLMCCERCGGSYGMVPATAGDSR